MSVLTGIVAGAALLYEIRKRQARMEAIRTARELTTDSEIISCLVKQVYVADGGQRAHASKVWKALGYEEHDLKADQSHEDICSHGSSPCPIRFMVFRRRHTDIRGTTWTAVRPEFVVAIRGTKLSKKDAAADLLVAAEALSKSKDYPAILRMTRKTVEKYEYENVCVAGHSLGAALGLLVARQFALKGEFVKTHLFNPPFVTLGTIFGKGLENVGHLVPQLPTRIQEMYAKGEELFRDGVELVLNSERDKELQREMSEQFSQLQKWMPHLYVNSHDLICNQYIEYFQDDKRSSTSTSSRVLQKLHLVRNAKSYHLIPSAVLHTNHRSHPVNKLVCHKLTQWFNHPTNGTSRSYRLKLPHQHAV